MPAEIHLFDIYRTPNIGIFLRTNDKFSLVPGGLALSKREKLEPLLQTKLIQISIAGSRLLGPLVAMNNNGIVVSRLAEDEEVETLERLTGMKVEKLNSRFTSVGNLITANDNGAVASDIFSDESVKAIERVLGVPVKRMRIGNYVQLGAMVCATNSGSIVHPIATEREINEIRLALRVDPEPATVNGGVPFVGSGFVGNTKGILLGNSTRGGELVIIGRAFGA
ncbi:MAG: translation initiation factor IF-6 [archaeon]|nr:translation initiation factor IF-6 [archaeon]